MINVDDVHFLSAKNKSIFKIKTKVGPYVFNARTAGIEAELLLKKINFKPNFTWFYDTLGYISKMRIEKKYTRYSHTPRPEMNNIRTRHYGWRIQYKRKKRKMCNLQYHRLRHHKRKRRREPGKDHLKQTIRLKSSLSIEISRRLCQIQSINRGHSSDHHHQNKAIYQFD